jgi:hypothetical protein
MLYNYFVGPVTLSNSPSTAPRSGAVLYCIIRHRFDNGADLTDLSPTIPAHKIDCDQAHFPFITVAVSDYRCISKE